MEKYAEEQVYALMEAWSAKSESIENQAMRADVTQLIPSMLDLLYQHVSYTDLGDDQLGIARVGFDFLSQMSNIDPEAVDGAGVILSPDSLGKMGMGNHVTRVLHKVLQNSTFDEREADLLTFVGKLECGRIEAQQAAYNRGLFVGRALLSELNL